MTSRWFVLFMSHGPVEHAALRAFFCKRNYPPFCDAGIFRGSASEFSNDWRENLKLLASVKLLILETKSEGRWFDPRWCQWIISLTYSFRSHYGPGVDSASNRNEYQEHFLGVKAVGV